MIDGVKNFDTKILKRKDTKKCYLDGPNPDDKPIDICCPLWGNQHPIAKGNNKPECVDKNKVFFAQKKKW